MMNRNHPIGIDIQSDGVRALQLASNSRGLSIQASAHLPLADRLKGSAQELDALKPVLRRLSGLRTFKGKRVVASLPHDYLYVFPVTLEMTGQQSFEAMLAQACRKHLSFPLEQAVIDYFCVEEMACDAGRKLRVTVVAVQREQVDRVVRLFKQARYSVDIIDYGLCALIRLHRRIHSLTESPIVLVHMEEESILLAVAARAKIIAHRQLDWGIGRLKQRIAEMLGPEIERQQAQAMLSDYGVDYDGLQQPDGAADPNASQPNSDQIAALRVVSQIIATDMETLVQELFQVIGYARSVSPQIRFQELWLYGMANTIRNLGPFLERRLGFPAHRMDPLSKLVLHNTEILDADGIDSYIHALGLALREAA